MAVSKSGIRPRIIIHGGAGNITRETLPRASYDEYRTSLLAILSSATNMLDKPGATALDVATYAVSLLENDPLFNAGKGAVFTSAGTNELESSIMVSNGYHNRGVGCMQMQRIKNPIKLAREMLIRGEEMDGGGAGAHCQLSGSILEDLAGKWGIEMVDPIYFWTKRRWEEHLKGLERRNGQEAKPSPPAISSTSDLQPNKGDRAPVASLSDAGWDGKEYLPQGTVGAVVLDGFGTICVATSTGGLTNKLPGRIGDTPTLGAGFWAEEWFEDALPDSMYQPPSVGSRQLGAPIIDGLSRGNVFGLLRDCLPTVSIPTLSPPLSIQVSTPQSIISNYKISQTDGSTSRHALAFSGTGNGDSFLRLSACRTACAMSRFGRAAGSTSVLRVAGPGGELQRSAGDRWGKTGEGEGGMIGIELVGDEGEVVMEFNCGGMFRAWVDNEGGMQCLIFRGDY